MDVLVHSHSPGGEGAQAALRHRGRPHPHPGGSGQGVQRHPERIRQIEAKALRKLRHPSRSKKLKDFLN